MILLVSDVAYCDPPEPVTVLMAELRNGSIKKGDKITIPTSAGMVERTVMRLQHFTNELEKITKESGPENFGVFLAGWGDKNIQVPFEVNNEAAQV